MRIDQIIQRYLLTIIGLLLLSHSVMAQSRPSEKVWVLPFQVYATDDMAYLGGEIKKALEAKLKTDGATIVSSESFPPGWGDKEKMDPEMIRLAGRQAGADFVLWGSLTWIGEQYSIDANVIQTITEDSPRSVFAADKGVETIPATVAALSRDLGYTIFKQEKVVEVKITGNQRIEADAILKNIQTRPGDVFLTKSLSEDLKRIYAMGYFEDVRIESEEGGRGKPSLLRLRRNPLSVISNLRETAFLMMRN